MTSSIARPLCLLSILLIVSLPGPIAAQQSWLEGLQAVPGMGPAPATGTPSDQSVLFENVAVFDGRSKELAAGMNVLVVGNKIEQVSAEPIEAPEGAQVIAGGGKTLMPGMIDGHVHLAIPANYADIEANYTAGELAIASSVTARLALFDGFTTVRDMGGPVLGLKRSIDSGRVLGPRIYASEAFISQTSGHGDFRAQSDPNPSLLEVDDHSAFARFGISIIADGRAALLAAVRQNLMMGASQIKIMAGGGGSSKYDPFHTTQYTREEMEAAVQAAADWGTYVGAHLFTPESAKRFIEAGGKSIEHGFFLDDSAMKLAAKKGVFVVPQMWGLSPELDNNPNMPPSKVPLLAKIREQYGDFGKRLIKRRVKVAFASDLVGSVEDGVKARRYELYWRTEAFGSNYEVLKQLTSVGGELVALSGKLNPYPGKLGVIEPGALADILIVDGNPLEDISVLGGETVWFAQPTPEPISTIQLIMKDGVIFKNSL